MVILFKSLMTNSMDGKERFKRGNSHFFFMEVFEEHKLTILKVMDCASFSCGKSRTVREP